MIPENIDLHVESMAQGGDGVGRYQGYVVFASGGLPGEDVRVHIDERKASYARGHVVEVRTPSPDRVAPSLPGADHIPWQHIAYHAQLRFKQQILREQLAKLAGLHDVVVEDVIPAAAQWGYRTTTHMHAHANGERLGYYATGSRTVVDCEADPLLLPVLNEALAGLRRLIPDAAVSLGSVTLRGSVTHNTAIAVLHGNGDLAALATRWQEHVGALSGCLVREHSSRTGQRISPRHSTPDQPPVTLDEQIDEVVFSLSPESFFQSNTAQTNVLLEIVRGGLRIQPADRLLDAYSGVGTFALPLARVAQEVVAIEEHAVAVADGERSAARNDIGNVRFVTAAVERVLETLEPPFAAAILDPPRRGCHPAALAALAALAPPRIAYISCHPALLARDMRRLLDAGYRLVRLQPVDMFPQTPHIECVALLERG